MLTLSEGRQPGKRAYAGVAHGAPDYVLEEYFERWVNSDALASEPARASYAATGRASVADAYPLLDTPRRRFVDDFLRRTGTPAQLSTRLPAGWSEGYLTLMGPEVREREERLAAALAPRLTELLRAFLPRGLDARLSRREAQVSELVALGFSNREIAGVLHVEEDTVKKYVSRVLTKLGLTRRTSLAVAWATGRRIDLR